MTAKHILRTLNAKNAISLDEDLMSTGAFSLDQLMELAGLSVASALYRLRPQPGRILITCGPGNNGGDGLVAARHLHHFGYTPLVHYPKSSSQEIYKRLKTQLMNLQIEFTDDFEGALEGKDGKKVDHIVDAIFGFSFKGEVRDPFRTVISAMETTKIPVLSVDTPSSWSIEDGPPRDGPGAKFMPEALISLTAPKPLVKHYRGRHFVGGRFLPQEIADKYHLDQPPFNGDEQVVEVAVEGQDRKL